MGWWKCENGIIGDWPADILDGALRKIEESYLAQCGRLPTQGELANLIEFCTCGVLRPECGDPKAVFTQATVADESTPRVAERGSQGVCGINAKPPGGHLANVDPASGQFIPQEHAEGVFRQQLDEIEDKRQQEKEQ